MCGVFAYLGLKKEAGNLILEGLRNLEYRGYDSWGIALKKEDGQLYLEKHVGKINQAKLPKFTCHIGIGHTRWATHGGITDYNAHPHTDCKKNVVIVHNGIFENFLNIKKRLIKNGHRFSSETDSEVIAHLIEEKLSLGNSRIKAVINSFQKIQGLNAIIVFFPKEEEFYAIKNGSPIVFGQNNNEFILASDSIAIIPYTKKAYFLDDYHLLVIKQGEAKLYDTYGKEKKINFIDLIFDKKEVSLGNFHHFMIKEISEQPKILQNIIETQRNTIEKAASFIKNSYGSYLIGCGSAFYAALSGTYLFSKIAKRHINASVASEFSYLVNFLKPTSLVIALSQSGETIDIIASIRKAKEKKAKIMAITNVLGSTLYRAADYKILLSAGPEKCVVATKSFTAKIAILYLLAYSLNGGFEKGKIHVKKTIQQVKKVINSDSKKIKKLAHHLKDKKHIYILGRGSSYPTALESALKIKEVSYLHAEGFAAGELKHGVIALIEKGTPVIVYNPEDETYDDTLSAAYEVKARGAYVIGISSKKNSVFDEFVKVENCYDLTIIPNVVIAQLLGYYLALERGFDPDKPRNLAKSVTVK